MPPNQRLDSFFRCLAHPHRRYVVTRLNEVETPMPTVELAREIARRTVLADEAEADPIDVAHLQLRHVHLPVLSGSGVIEFDEENGLVSPEEVGIHLAAIAEIGRSISEMDRE